MDDAHKRPSPTLGSCGGLCLGLDPTEHPDRRLTLVPGMLLAVTSTRNMLRACSEISHRLSLKYMRPSGRGVVALR